MQTFRLKRGDTSPALRFALSPATVNLAGATVVFNMRSVGGVPVISRAAASIVTSSPPVVEYIWTAEDTAAPGLFQAEFEVTYTDGAVETFPNDGNITVQISGDLG